MDGRITLSEEEAGRQPPDCNAFLVTGIADSLDILKCRWSAAWRADFLHNNAVRAKEALGSGPATKPLAGR